jgi:hypothetical protein
MKKAKSRLKAHNKGKKRVRNSLTGRDTYVSRNRFTGLLSVLLSCLICLLIRPSNTGQIASGVTTTRVNAVAPTPTPTPEYIPSERTIRVINNNPGVAGKISRFYGEEWRQYAELISRESSFNPQAINPTSGACGLAQALPCSKMACELSDVECQLEWIKEYVEGRYGDIETALWHHDYYSWY